MIGLLMFWSWLHGPHAGGQDVVAGLNVNWQQKVDYFHKCVGLRHKVERLATQYLVRFPHDYPVASRQRLGVCILGRRKPISIRKQVSTLKFSSLVCNWVSRRQCKESLKEPISSSQNRKDKTIEDRPAPHVSSTHLQLSGIANINLYQSLSRNIMKFHQQVSMVSHQLTNSNHH